MAAAFGIDLFGMHLLPFKKFFGFIHYILQRTFLVIIA
jgi:hypothetical protein